MLDGSEKWARKMYGLASTRWTVAMSGSEEPAHRVRHRRHLLVGQLGEDGQAEHLQRRGRGDRQVAVARLDEAGQGGLVVEGRGVVDGRGDAALLEMGHQLVAPRRADGELVVDAPDLRPVGQQPQVADAGEGAVVAAGDLAAAGVVL